MYCNEYSRVLLTRTRILNSLLEFLSCLKLLGKFSNSFHVGYYAVHKKAYY